MVAVGPETSCAEYFCSSYDISLDGEEDLEGSIFA